MAIDFNKFGKSPSATTTSMAPVGTYAPTATPAQPVGFDTPVSEPVKSGVDFGKFGKSGSGLVAKRKEPKENPLAAMAKGIFGAPATMVARPFQLAVEAILPGDNTAAIDKFSKEKLGGIVAPIPQDYGDVKKDVGRGIQTVALGTGAPIAGGAAFGLGASLEQGNDLLSIQTAFNTALGGAGGKVLEVIGKPLFNAAGKVVGVVTPQVLKDVAAKGAGAIQKFMQENKLLGGAFAPASEKIATGLQAVDDKIVGGIKNVASKTGEVLKEQYPNVSATEHYQKINEKDFLRPTTVNEPKYAKASRVFEDAKSRGIDLEKVATEDGIVADQLADGGRYNTLDTVENIRERNYQAGTDRLRPALRIAEGEVRAVTTPEVRAAMLRKIDAIPQSQITPKDRAWMRRQVEINYADTGAAAGEHPYGYKLTDLHDNRIISQKNGKYKIDGSALENRPAELARLEGSTFADLLDSVIPEDLPAAQFRKELEKRFRLANYLEALHGKGVPAGLTKKAVRLFGKTVSAIVGGKVAGLPGSIFGAQAGDVLFSTFEALPNPIKVKVLNSVKVEDPKVFKELMDYIARKGQQRLETPLLPAAGQSSFKPENPRLFTTPGGKSTPVMQEALDIAAVESGAAKQPTTDTRLFNRRVQENLERSEPYTAPDKLPVIKAGKKPRKSLNQLYKDLPIIDVDTPLPTLKKKTLSSNFIPESPKQASVDPLITEARKYKSAEEFVKKQEPIAQFTDEGKAGKFWTVPEGADEGFGSIRKDAFVDTSKIYNGKTNSREFLEERGLLTQKMQDKIDNAWNSTDPNMEYQITQDAAEAVLKKEGYSGAKWLDEDDLNPTQYQIWDNSIVKTKSQLTDIWNTANKGNAEQSLLQEARKYKSAEEFVKGQDTFYRAEGGGTDPARGKALLAEGKHFAMDAEYPKRFGDVKEYVAKPNARVFDASGLDFKDIRSKLGLEPSNYLSPTEYTKALKANGYDILKYDGTYKSTGKDFVHTVEITPNSLIPKSQLTDIWEKANGKK